MSKRIALLLLNLAAVAGTARAQSLADVSKKEEERRKTVSEPAKVYTNKDLTGVPAESTPPPPASKPADAKAAKDAKAKDDKGSADVEKDPVKDQAYWSAKLKALQTKLDQDQTYAEAMQTRINSLTTDAVNRDDPIQRGKLERDRQKALADLAGLKKSAEEGKKAIAQVHEDARRAGVPPGWLR